MDVQNKQKLEYTEVWMHTNIGRLCLENNIKKSYKNNSNVSTKRENAYILFT